MDWILTESDDLLNLKYVVSIERSDKVDQFYVFANTETTTYMLYVSADELARDSYFHSIHDKLVWFED